MADTLPLVGRSDEIAMLQQLLDDASEGRGSAIFVAGEGGVGKTRLATTVAAKAAERGWATAIGRAYPVETGVPYAVFSDAMMPLLRELDQSALALLTRGGASELAALFPALTPADRAQSAARGDPSEIKTRLLWNFAQFLGRYAAKKPLLLVLENLQWADSASLELLHFVARQLGSMRVAVVCTYNEMERDQSPALRTTESSLVSLGAARVHSLGPLTRAETDALLREAFGAEGGTAREFAALLYGWTRGNPFFLEEVLSALIDAGTLYQREGAWHGWEVETMTLPASIREALIARVSRLSPAARALADVAAVIGTRASYDALRTVTTVERTALLAALDELRLANVLVESESAGGVVYDFAHPMVRDAIYGELGLARARQLHATVAESLERFHGQRALEHADELAFHFARANAADLTPKAIRYLSAAGRAALNKHANREGANYLTAALELADRSPATDGDSAVADGEPPLVDQLARARQRLGEYDAALALWERALSDAMTAKDDLRVAAIERRMGLASYWRGRHQDALGHYERGIAAAERAGNVVLAARLLIATGVTYVELGRPADGEREIQRALAVAESRKDPSLMARAHRALLLLHAWTGSPERAREHGAQAIDLSRESDQLTVEWSAHWALALLGGLTGNAEETQRHLRESERLADQLHSPVLRLWSAEIEIEVASAQGDWSGALAIAERSVGLARVLGQRALLPRLLVWTGILYLGRGEMELGKASIDEAWELSGASRAGRGHVDVHTVVPAHTGRAAYHLAVGEHAEAVRVGRAGLAIADRSGYVVWGIYRLLPVIAEASLRVNDLDSARWVGERLRRDSERVGHPLGLAWADACDALVATLAGDAERGLGVLRDAASALEAIPFVPDAARLRRELGFRLAELGDRDGALRELRSAHDVFAKLGAAPELATAREQIRELGARPPTRASAPGAAGLTPRELEIVRLVAARKSNKEIGKALDISSRTVSTHLSNIFTKLGVATRGELTDYAREKLR